MVQLSDSVLRLHRIDFRCVVNVVSEKVDSFASRVYFSLIYVLALSEHSSSIHYRTILRSEQLCHLHDYCRACSPRRAAPFLPSLHGSLYSHFHFLLAHLVICSENVLVVVRACYLSHVAGTDFLSANDYRYVNY